MHWALICHLETFMVFKLQYIFFLKKTCVELTFAYGHFLFAKSYAGSQNGLEHSALA